MKSKIRTMMLKEVLKEAKRIAKEAKEEKNEVPEEEDSSREGIPLLTVSVIACRE